MPAATYAKHERIWMKDHPEYSEHWVQKVIADDPSLLRLGDLTVLAQQRRHPGAGKLDLLLQDQDARRYEVELQLGSVDESHIIRCIEYWDIERKRYPQYDHCAVIIAEDITSRFLNVISLFNGTIPLIAIQMQLIKVGNHTTLVFTTVMNELKRGLVDGDEPISAPVDRAYWEAANRKDALTVADDFLKLVRQIDKTIEANFTQTYIALVKDRQNFLSIEPRKTGVVLNVRLPNSEYIDDKVQELDRLPYASGFYRLKLRTSDLTEKKAVVEELIRLAHEQREERQ